MRSVLILRLFRKLVLKDEIQDPNREICITVLLLLYKFIQIYICWYYYDVNPIKLFP